MSTYWHFCYTQNPSFCPSKYHTGMNMDDRFKASVGCFRPCSCYECKTLNIDRAVRVPLTFMDSVLEVLGKVLYCFFNFHILWGVASAFIFAISQSYFAFDILARNIVWYSSMWCPVAFISRCFCVLFLWVIWQIWSLG